MNNIYQLSDIQIDQSEEIQNWLSQFTVQDRYIVKDILLHLKFISDDTFTEWIIKHINILSNDKCAFYAARKFYKNGREVHDNITLWDEDSNILNRPGTSLGSEDYICSIIHNIKKSNKNFFDHPSIKTLKDNKIHNIIIIDDSIGSGKRICEYLTGFFHSKTIKSWWSFGLIKIYIFSYVIYNESKKSIISALPGSDHGIRKYRKSKKIIFINNFIYHKENKKNRWGENYRSIYEFCTRNYKKNINLGYGDTMSNIIFIHSVPNNIPGILWKNTKNYCPLFPNRVIPQWMINILENKYTEQITIDNKIFDTMQLQLLQLLKKGVKSESSLSHYLEIDSNNIRSYLEILQQSGFIDNNSRITQTGKKLLLKTIKQLTPDPDFSLYVPTKWRIDQ